MCFPVVARKKRKEKENMKRNEEQMEKEEIILYRNGNVKWYNKNET